MVLNTAPGCNSWVGAEPDNATSLVAASRAKARAQESLLHTYQPVQMQSRGPLRLREPGWLTADPLPDPTPARVQIKTNERTARVNAGSQLAFAVSQGYGRVPTTFVHTSAGSLLPTTELQSPTRAAAAQPEHHLFSFSAPCSPAEPRSLLFSRLAPVGAAPPAAPVATQCQSARGAAVDTVDLLDRLTLLRRITPTTYPGTRPFLLQRHAAAVEHTAAPLRRGGAASFSCQEEEEQQQQQRQQTGVKKWRGVLDDGAAESPRPIAAVPAPGWHYQGDFKGGKWWLQGNQAKEGRPVQEISCQTEPPLPPVVVVVTNAPEHEEADGSACCAEASHHHSRPAFRPPGQLHRRGQRPKSAPPPTRAAPRPAHLRPCGCPRPSAGLAEKQRATRRAAELEAQREECTVIVTSPRPATGGCQLAAPSTTSTTSTTMGAAAEGHSHSTLSVRVREGCCGVAAVHEDCNCQGAAGAAGADTANEVCIVSSPRRVHEDHDLIVVASPRGAGGGTDYVVISHDHATAPRTRGSYPRSPSPRPIERLLPQAPAPPPAAATAGATDSVEAATDLPLLRASHPTTVSVTLPAGAKNSHLSISARLGSPSVEAGSLGTRPHVPPPQTSKLAGELQALTSEIQRRESSFKGMLGELERITAKCAELTSAISTSAGAGAGTGARPRSAAAAAAATGRRVSFAPPAAMPSPDHRICTYVAGAGLPVAASKAPCSGVSSLRGCASEDAGDAIPAARLSSLGSEGSNGACSRGCSGMPAKEGGAGSSPGLSRTGRMGGGSSPAAAAPGGEEWSWESLMQFERTIKEQHRKLVEQGVLPPDLC